MKYNHFLTPELQATMKKISDIRLECVRNALPNAMASQIQQIQESLTAPCRELIQSYSSIMSSSLASQVSQLSKSLNSSIRDNITADLYSVLSESVKNDFSYRELQQQVLNLTPTLRTPSKTFDYPENLGGLPKDDYVVVDEQAVKTYELPDSVYLPVGNSRVKMPTSFLLALVDLIVNTALTIFLAIVQSNSPQPEQVKQVQIEEAQLELQRAQNEMLHQLLHDIDVSLSSEAESIKELQESVEELHKHYLQTQYTCSPVEESTDNSKLPEDTDTQEK